MSKAQDISKKKTILLLILLVLVISLATTGIIFYKQQIQPQKESDSSTANVALYVKGSPEPQSSTGVVSFKVVNNEGGK